MNMNTLEHRFSVITITHNRNDHLHNVIRGIEKSILRPLELIVVYMNQPDEITGNFSVPIRNIHLDDANQLPLAEARNLGAKSAHTDYLIFLDVDCIPSSTMFSDILATNDIENSLIMGNPLYLKPHAVFSFIEDETLKKQSVPHEGRTHLKSRVSKEYTAFWSLCFALSTQTSNKIGGFDSGFTGYGGEDTDFALSAKAANIPFIISDAVCYHQNHAVYKPPIQHVKDIVINSNYYFNKWNVWPMEGWLKQFVKLNLINWNPQQTTPIILLREPSESEIAQCRDTISAY